MVENKIHCAECQQEITGKYYQHKEINDWNKFCSENCLSFYYYGKECGNCKQKKLKVAEWEGQNYCQDCFAKQSAEETSSEQLEAELEELFRQAEERIKKNLSEVEEYEQKKKKKTGKFLATNTASFTF